MGKERVPGDTRSDREDRRLIEELNRAVASGDRDARDRAFEAIWHRHAPTVSLVCARFLRDDADILSVTDEVFVRFFHAAPTLTLTVPLRAYLATLAKNAALNHLRAAVRRESHLSVPPAYEEGDPLATVADPDADVGASVRYRELVSDLRSVLDAREVEIILRHAVWGETFAEIANRSSTKENTVKTQYHRALKTYRKKKGVGLP